MLPLAIVLVGTAMLMVSGVGAWLRIRRRRAQAIVVQLDLLVSQNLPLLHGMAALARGERGALRATYRRMAERLAAGDALSVAMRDAYRAIPGDVLGALQAGEASGTLPTVLRRLAREPVGEEGPATAPLAYALVLLWVLSGITLLAALFLAPQLRDVWADFGLHSFPLPTRMLFELARGDRPVWVVGGGALLTLAAVYVWLRPHFATPGPDRVGWLRRGIDTLLWHTPVARGIAETRALARQLPLLQAAVSAGYDLPAAARQASLADANQAARARLLRWAEVIEGGVPPAAAAARVGLPAVLRRALGARPRELAASLAYLADYYGSLVVHWERVAVQVATPVLVLLLSAVIGFVIYALYAPLFALYEVLLNSLY